jgi:hypothetical protein
MQSDMKAALDTLEPAAADVESADKFVSARGLQLQLRRFSVTSVWDAARKLQQPKPPKWMNEDKGREKDNPNDPTYLEALRMYNYDLGMLAVSAAFILGTKVLAVPEDMEPVDGPDWAELVMAAVPDTDIPERGPRRYLTWLRYYAMDDADQARLLTKCLRFNGGTMEGDVGRAMQNFRDNQAGVATTGVLAAVEGEPGHSNGVADGDGTGVRSPGSLTVLPPAVDDVQDSAF